MTSAGIQTSPGVATSAATVYWTSQSKLAARMVMWPLRAVQAHDAIRSGFVRESAGPMMRSALTSAVSGTENFTSRLRGVTLLPGMSAPLAGARVWSR